MRYSLGLRIRGTSSLNLGWVLPILTEIFPGFPQSRQ